MLVTMGEGVCGMLDMATTSATMSCHPVIEQSV
jgi:hypothetical protein